MVKSYVKNKEFREKGIGKTLVIVESPAKCKKIEEYLGSNYSCMASFGHIRELSSLQQINVKHNFTPQFTIIENVAKRTQIEKLKKAISMAEETILATDDDREGEAIAWHICDLFHLNVSTTQRIVFHEITETAIQYAIMHPKRIDMDLVNAQIARQVLDMLVGFHISPVLWRQIGSGENGLSAGRCQTPALRIIHDNHCDIVAHPGEMTYQIVGCFTHHNIEFHLKKHDKKVGNHVLDNHVLDNHVLEKDIVDFLKHSMDYDHVFHCAITVPGKTLPCLLLPVDCNKLPAMYCISVPKKP